MVAEITPGVFQNELAAFVNEYGIERTYLVLIEARKNPAPENDNAAKLLALVAGIQQITVDELIYGKTRNNKRHVGLCLAAYALEEFLKQQPKAIPLIILKSYPRCNQYRYYIESLIEKTKVKAFLTGNEQKIVQKVEQLKQALIQQNIISK